MRRRIALVIGLVVVALFAGTLPASASTVGLSGSLTRHAWVNYSTQRTITASGSSIFVKKTDGPEIDVKWRRCAGGAQGSPVRLQNADPTPRVRIGTNFLPGTGFCLSAYSYGSNSTDTWNGNLWWNVFS